jgi:hypothetical protein
VAQKAHSGLDFTLLSYRCVVEVFSLCMEGRGEGSLPHRREKWMGGRAEAEAKVLLRLGRLWSLLADVVAPFA